MKYYPQIKKAYPNLDHDTMDRVAKYCVVYAKDTTMKSVRKAMNEWQDVFDTDLQWKQKHYSEYTRQWEKQQLNNNLNQ